MTTDEEIFQKWNSGKLKVNAGWMPLFLECMELAREAQAKESAEFWSEQCKFKEERITRLENALRKIATCPECNCRITAQKALQAEGDFDGK